MEDDPLNEKYKYRVEAERKTQITLQQMQKDFLSSINAYALVLVLLASVTFVGLLQPPGGLQSLHPAARESATNLQSPANEIAAVDNNPHYVVQRREMVVFIVFNSLSFILSVADLLLCVISSLSPLTSVATTSWAENWIPAAYEGHLKNLKSEQATTKLLAHYVASTLVKLIFVNGIFAISLTCCVVAFGAAGLVLVLRDFKNANFLAVVGTLIVGSVLFTIFLVWLLIDTCQFMKKAVTDESLSTALQHRAGNLQVQFRYLHLREKY